MRGCWQTLDFCHSLHITGGNNSQDYYNKNDRQI